jgi:hypothetical protein
MPSYGLIDRGYGQRLRAAASSADGPIYMLSLTKYRADSELRQRGPGLIGRDDDGRYAPIPLLTSVGAALCFVADVVAGFGDWDRVAVVGYPTRRSFVQLADRRDFQDWHLRKEPGMVRTIVMGTLPAADLPAPESSRRILLEAWDGPEPGQVTGRPAIAFEVEGTVIGDGRRWSGVRYTAMAPGVALPLIAATPGYQALLLTPTIERWACLS